MPCYSLCTYRVQQQKVAPQNCGNFSETAGKFRNKILCICSGFLPTLCAKYTVSQKVPTFKLSVTLSNLNRFSRFFAMKFLRNITHLTLGMLLHNLYKLKFSEIFSRYKKGKQFVIFLVFKIASLATLLIANKIFHVTVLLLIYSCDQFMTPEIRHSRRHCRVQCLSTINMVFSEDDKIVIKSWF